MDRAERGRRKAVVAVLLPREHLPFIRDWCLHHLEQGWDVFLYDNSGSTGSTRQSSIFRSGRLQRAGFDKRGSDYRAYTAHLSDAEVAQQMRVLLSGLPVKIGQWQPRGPSGQIVHGQVEAYVDFIRRFRGQVDWAAFIDADEYLEAGPGLEWDDLLHSVEDQHCHRVAIEAHAYESRWSREGLPRELSTLRCCGLQLHKGRPAGVKNIVRLDRVVRADIHWNWVMADADLKMSPDITQYYFKHYNALGAEIKARIMAAHHDAVDDEGISV